MISLIEVKRDALTRVHAEEQMAQYMERALEHGNRSDDFRGYLVLGKDILVYGYAMVMGRRRAEVTGSFSMLDAGDPFTRALSQMSVHNWNA
jgi:hypothetical protein